MQISIKIDRVDSNQWYLSGISGKCSSCNVFELAAKFSTLNFGIVCWTGYQAELSGGRVWVSLSIFCFLFGISKNKKKMY